MKIIPILFFGVIFGALLVSNTPDVTWANGDRDLFGFLYSANTLSVPHAPGMPLYIMLGWLVLRIPGNDAWLLSLFLSLVPTLITTFLIFKIAQGTVKNPLLWYISALAYPASFIVFSQSTIPEIYAMTTMFMVLAYYLIGRGHYRFVVISLSLGSAITYLPLVAFVVMLFAYKEIRRHWYWIFSALPLYLFLFLAIREPYLSTFRRDDFGALYNFFMHHGTLAFSIPVWEIPQRIYEYSQIIIVSLSIALIPVIIGFSKNKRLLWLTLPFVIYGLTTLGPISYWHLMPAVAFAVIAIPKGLEYLPKETYPAMLISGLLLIGWNTLDYDIGRTLDKSPTGARTFLRSLDRVEDNSIIVAWDTSTYAGVFYYNHKETRNLRPILPIFKPHVEENEGIRTGKWKPFDWELEKYKKLGLSQYEYKNGLGIDKYGFQFYNPDQDELYFIEQYENAEHLAETQMRAILTTQVFSKNHPNEMIYVAVQSQHNLDRREISLVKVINGEIVGSINGSPLYTHNYMEITRW